MSQIKSLASCVVIICHVMGLYSFSSSFCIVVEYIRAVGCNQDISGLPEVPTIFSRYLGNIFQLLSNFEHEF